MKDPYIYEGTDVLINKLSIKDKFQLNNAESDFAILAIEKLKHSNFTLNTIFDFLELHKQLFCNLFDWAGKIRTINIYKGEKILNNKSIDYVYASYINVALDELNQEFIIVNWDILSEEEKLEKIHYFISEFWHVHPFREGNTRTSALALYFLIKKSGLKLNSKFLFYNSKYFRNSLVYSSLYNLSKKEYLLKILLDCVI